MFVPFLQNGSIGSGKVVAEGLKYNAIALNLSRYLDEMLGEQASHRVRGLELLGEHAFGGEDTHQHLHVMLKLLACEKCLPIQRSAKRARGLTIPGSALLPDFSPRRYKKTYLPSV